jgi:hypothetical protein
MASTTTSTTTSSRARTRYGGKLGYSCCRLDGASKEFPSLCPVFIASKEHGIVLCRVEPPLQRPCAVDNTLYFDSSVQLIYLSQYNCSMENSLSDLLQAISLRRFRISFSSAESDRSSSSSKDMKLPGCCHSNCQVQTVVCHELLDRHSQESSFCGIPLLSCVAPLLSISIRTEPGITGSPPALESANIKRHLAGVHVAFREGKFSSSLLVTDSKGYQVKYYVDAVSSKRRDANVRTVRFLPIESARLMRRVGVC